MKTLGCDVSVQGGKVYDGAPDDNPDCVLTNRKGTEAQHPELIGDSSHGEAIHVKTLGCDASVQGGKVYANNTLPLGCHAPESYRTTKRGQTSTPENPLGGSGDFFWGVKRF